MSPCSWAAPGAAFSDSVKKTSNMRRDKNRARFPPREGNGIEMLVDGPAYYPAMLQAIEEARAFVLMEMYLFASGWVAERFVKALSEAARRSVAVYVLIDEVGSRELKEAERRALQSAGVHLGVFNPLGGLTLRRLYQALGRNHRKLLLIDGVTAFTGGAGIADAFDRPGRQQASWHDIVLRIQGPCVRDWQDLFEETWRREGHPPPPRLIRPTPARPEGLRGQLRINSGLRTQEISRSLLNHIQGARRRVWLATAYFAPTRRLRKALKRAAARGVDVRLLLPGAHSDHPLIQSAGRRFYASLLRQGVRVYEYQPRFLHAKCFLCDDWVSLGSSNLDHWTQHWNLEANQEAWGEDIAATLAQVFETDFAQSRQWHWMQWRRRGRIQRFVEIVLGVIDAWITRRAHNLAVRHQRKRGRDE